MLNDGGQDSRARIGVQRRVRQECSVLCSVASDLQENLGKARSERCHRVSFESVTFR